MGQLLARDFSGPSIKFDGAGTKIVSTNALDFTAAGTNGKVTFMAWVRLVDFSGSKRFIGAATGQYICGISAGALVFIGVNGQTPTTFMPASSFGKEWKHVCFTHDGVTLKGYFNGVLVGSSASAIIPTASYALQVGYDASTYGNQYLAEPAVFNRALTAAEIALIYEQGPAAYPNDGSCVLDYRFKEGAINAATIIDASGKGNHGTLTIGSGRVDPYQIPVPNRILMPADMPLLSVESAGTTAMVVTDSYLKLAFRETGAYVGSAANGVTVGGWVKGKRNTANARIFAKGAYGSGNGTYGDLLSNKTVQTTVPEAPSTVAAFRNQYVNMSLFSHAANIAITGTPGTAKFFNHGRLSQLNNVNIGSAPSGDSLNIVGGTGAGLFNIALPFLANRALTDEEIYRIYQSASFPPDVLFWHGPDAAGTKIMCHKGFYGNRPAEVAACDATLGSGNTFSTDTPWN
jgi:hypothetical protein